MVAWGGAEPGDAAPSWGWIMPAPFAVPKMLTATPSMSITARATFIFVSVVMMAVAKSSAWPGVPPRVARSAGMALTIFSAGSGTPMIPVEEGKTSSKRQPRVWAAALQVSIQARMPGSPVAQLALPALTRTAETRPPVDSRCLRPTVTGAATTWLRVNMATAFAPPGAKAAATSRFPLALIPALTAPHSKPSGKVPTSFCIGLL